MSKHLTDVEWIRERYRDSDKSQELVQLSNDTWVTSRLIGIHQDTTKPGLVTYGLVLINDLGLELHYQHGIFPLQVGDAYRIDGRRPHGALPGCNRSQLASSNVSWDLLFAFRAWDVPPTLSLYVFKREMWAETINREWTDAKH